MDVNLNLTETARYLMKYFPPLGIVLPLIVLYNGLALYLVSNKLDRRSSRRVPAFISGIVKIFFRGALRTKRTGPSLLDKEFALFGYPAPAGLVNSLGLLTIILLIATTSAFFDVFLKISCHTYAGDLGRQCKASFNYIQSAGAVGGTLILTIIVIHLKMTIIMWMIKKKNRAVKRNTRRAWICLLIVTETVIGIVIFIVSVGFSFTQLINIDGYYELVQELLYDISVLQSSYFSLLVAYFNWNTGRRTCKGPQGDVEPGITESLRSGDLQLSWSTDETLDSSYRLINDNEPEGTAI